MWHGPATGEFMRAIQSNHCLKLIINDEAIFDACLQNLVGKTPKEGRLSERQFKQTDFWQHLPRSAFDFGRHVKKVAP